MTGASKAIAERCWKEFVEFVIDTSPDIWHEIDYPIGRKRIIPEAEFVRSVSTGGLSALQDGSCYTSTLLRGHVLGRGNTAGTLREHPSGIRRSISVSNGSVRKAPGRPVANEGENSARLWCWR